LPAYPIKPDAIDAIDAAKALTATFLGRFPGVPIAPSADRHGNPVPGGGTFGAYSRTFGELIAIDAEAAAAAAALAAGRHLIANTLPTEGAIREAFAELRQGPARTGLEAWGDVMGLLRRGYSSHAPPAAADLAHDPIAWECLQAITWRAVCRVTEDDAALRSQFVAAYNGAVLRRQRAGVAATVPSASRLLEQRGVGELVGGALRRLTEGT
jgi:hypothetical protein